MLLLSTALVKAQIYKDPKAPVDARVADLLSRMTFEEKLSYIGGINWMYTKAIPRLAVPGFKMSDGPVGTRTEGKSTAYPASILSTATWDTTLIGRLGVALGRDARSRGVNFLLGPAVNIYRAPMDGRNFEYSGEDPFLAGSYAVSYIRGVQSQEVVATIKHFAANNEEYDRDNISSDIDQRTLQEIYLGAFKAGVKKGNVGAVMNSYNLLNGTHTSENNHLNNEILKGQWGFTGLVMSDWGSVHDGLAAFKGGTDLEMPGNDHMIPKYLLPAFKKGEITEKELDAKITRILRVCFSYSFFDRPQQLSSIPNDDPENAKVALDLARGGIVLLKNEADVLPLRADKVKKIAVIGPNADVFNTGGGSSQTDPYHYVSTLQGLKKLAGNIEVNYAIGIPSLSYLAQKSVFYPDSSAATIGLTAEYYANRDLSGMPKGVRVEKAVDHEWVQAPDIAGIAEGNFSARWTGVIRPKKTADYKIAVKGDDGYRLWIDNKLVIDFWSDHQAIERDVILPLQEGSTYSVKLEYYQNGGDASVSFAWYEPADENYNDAIETASAADAAIVCVGFNPHIEHEGADRPFELPADQDSLIQVVAKANPNTIVILNAGGGIYMEKWLSSVKGLIHAFYPGQEGGTALAEILLGKINPSGKLPVSIEKKWADNPCYQNYYDTDHDKHVSYKEGVLVGYRYYTTKKVEPQYPFGFGLSYSTFKYSNLIVSVRQQGRRIVGKASFDVTNTGDMDGAEVAELYVGQLSCPVLRPVEELKGFNKIFLAKGETRRVTIHFDESAFSYYKIQEGRFDFDAGRFAVLIASSAAHIELKKMIKIY